MAAQVSTKVRLVRCPRCRQVLAELPEVTLYKCGGCGAILQAKTRKVEANQTELSSPVTTDSVAKVQPDSISEEEEIQSSNHDLSNPPKGDSLQDNDNISCKDECGDSRMEPCEDRSATNALSTSPEVNGHETENSTTEVKKPFRHDEVKESNPENSECSTSHHLDQYKRVDNFEDDNVVERLKNLSENEDQENDLPSGGVEHREGRKNKRVSLENEEKSQNGGLRGEMRDAGVDSWSAGVVSHKNENGVDDGIEGLREKKLSARVGDSSIASQSALKGSIVSPDDEHLDHPMRKFRQNFGSATSVDTLASSPLADPPGSELDVEHGDMTHSPITRSYYGYDGSESSYDDDQSTHHISHFSRRKGKYSEDISATAMQKKDGYRANGMLSSEPEMNYWAPSSSVLQGRQHLAMKGSHWNHYEVTRGEGMTMDKEGLVSRLPFTDRTQTPSAYKHNLVPPHPGFHSPDKPSSSEPDEMDLLRTVCDLKDQLNRIQFLKAAANRRSPYYYDRLTPEREIYADLHHPRYRLHNQERPSRLAFSGEAAHYRHQINCSCLHCSPQDWHCSAQLPSRSTPCENGYCGVHAGHNHCNVSSFSSPEHYTSSELSLWGHETQPNNLRRRDREMQRLLREKYHTAKRHLRPVAGGAPVVPCYHCSELLQLPADFLLIKKRYHQLRCGACGKILRFSLLKSKHIIPYLPDVLAPPPSDQRNLAQLPHSFQQVEPVSHNDHYGRSFSGTTYSTEGEAPIVTPSSELIETNRNTYNRKMSYGSSYNPTEDRRMKSHWKEAHNSKNMDLVKNFESVGPSSTTAKLKKASSETEKPLPPTNSPLHRLMGYGSARQVLNK